MKALLHRYLERGLGGVFRRYLADAPVSVVRNTLLEMSAVDLTRMDRHRQALRATEKDPFTLDEIESISMATVSQQTARRAEDVHTGKRSLQSGEWAAIAFAGGAGTRFFSSLDQLNSALTSPNEILRRETFDAGSPKGVFPISPVAGLSFYEIIVSEALDAGVQSGRLPMVILLTSQITHQQTVAYLSQKQLWGFPSFGWIALTQAREPRLDEQGDLIVANEHGHLAWTGDGHGGVYRALLSPGRPGGPLLSELERLGIRHLVMHNVDNAAAHPFEPARLGFHIRENAMFTVSVVRKVNPHEKVGLVLKLKSSGRVEVVEYNMLDPKIASATDSRTGELSFNAGNINTNLVELAAIRDDVEPIVYRGKSVSSRVGSIKSSSLEMLNQHLTRLLDPDRVLAFEVDRQRFFMPTKNIQGEDSVVSTVAMLSNGFASLLRQMGAQVDPLALCDLHPACGLDLESLELRAIGPGWSLGPGSRLYLCARMGVRPGEPVFDGKITLHPGSTFILDGAAPYGKVTVDTDRQLQLDPSQASRISVGKDVVVEPGVRVVIHVDPNGTIRIPNGKVFKEDLDLQIHAHQSVEL